MSNVANNLTEILDLIEDQNLPVVQPISETPTKVEEVTTGEPITDDADFARTNIRKLIKDGAGSVDELIEIAKNSEHPRAYEVLSMFLKTISEMNKDLLDIHKKKKDLLQTSSPNSPTPVSGNGTFQVQNAVFVGSTADLAKMVKDNNAHNLPQ